MNKALRRIAIVVICYFFFAVLWRLLFDDVSGLKRRQREQYRERPECAEIVARVELFYRTNNAFPKNAEGIAKFPIQWRFIRSPDVLETNYIFHFPEAERAVRGGKTNVPVVFQRMRSVGKNRGGLVGFILPQEVRWYDEPEYQQHFDSSLRQP